MPADPRTVAESPACRRCADCTGQEHHWLEDCDESTGWVGYSCKHCPARAEMCDYCDDVIAPDHIVRSDEFHYCSQGCARSDAG